MASPLKKIVSDGMIGTKEVEDSELANVVITVNNYEVGFQSDYN